MTTKAFLFDLDGTLIDSMPHHQSAWDAWHLRHGLPMNAEDFFASTAGRSNAEIILDLLPGHSEAERATMADEKEALYRDFATQSLALIDGAQAFVEQSRAAGLRLAVCTASTLPNMALAFARHGIDGWVDSIVSPADTSSGTDVALPLRGKPHPDIFLEAARRLGVSPQDCIVFEDAPLGVEAARRAGMKAVALTTTLPADAFAGFDNILLIAPDFTTLALADLTTAHQASAQQKARHDA
ncbi:MAG: HAD family phosphatase [Rhizobiales bacterium]|nr:HAD family phosphatase [Rhizobacter sp.]